MLNVALLCMPISRKILSRRWKTACNWPPISVTKQALKPCFLDIERENTDPLVGRCPTHLVLLKIGTVRKSDVFHAAASFSEFYLKPWLDSAVKLQQFSLRRERLVIDKMHPSQICDQRDINTFEHSMLQNRTKKDNIWHTRLVVSFNVFFP